MADFMKPSEVFAARLQDTRKARGLSQTELAERATAAGRELDRAAVLRIEKGQRGVALDEAVALTRLLHAVPAQMLTAPGAAVTGLTGKEGVDGGGLRNWLLYGEPVLALTIAVDEEGTEPPDVLRGRLENDLIRHALALGDAARAEDKAGIRDAVRAIVRAVETYRTTAERGERANG
jgi:transcriptional regulator with XRE-family HTH domain